MSPSFHVDPLPAEPGLEVELPPSEAAHLSRVLRLGPGAEVSLFDGHGRRFDAVVVRATSHGVWARLVRPAPTPAELPIAVTLVQAALKADATDTVVRDTAMAGVGRIVPVVSARSALSLAALTRGHRVERWHRIAVSSVKQCGRAVVPEVAEPMAIGDAWRSVEAELRIVLAEPGATAGEGGNQAPRPAIERLTELPRPATVALAIGPEGGWEAGELAAALEAGWLPLTLGTLTLRADAAALVAMAALMAIWGAYDRAPVREPSRAD